MAQNLPRGTPARVLVLLSLLTGLVTVSAWRDALQRPGNTWVRYPTALGDTALLRAGHLPATLNTPGGQVGLSAGGAPLRRRDDRMFRVRTELEAILPFALFTTDENLAANPDPKLYARTSPHEYVRLRARVVNPENPQAPRLPPGPKAPGVANWPSVHQPGNTIPPAKPASAAEVTPDSGGPPQVSVGEDPDHMLALPAPAPLAPPLIPALTPPDVRGVAPKPDPPASTPEPAAPRAIPLPPEEQDPPPEEPAAPTL